MPNDTALINSMIDIREVAEHAGAEFKGNHSHCPIHNGDNPTAFSIFDNGKAWKCFTHEAECNRHGHDGIGLLMALNNWTFKQVCEKYNQPIDPLEAARRAAENAKRIEQELQRKIEEAQKAIEELRKARRWIEYHNNMGEGARQLWRDRGVADSWQDYYKFGYSVDFPYSYKNEYYTSPTLTIPLFAIGQDEPGNIKHRLLEPAIEKSKYRYEKNGLPAMLFYGDKDLPADRAERVVIVEGEIKAAVTMQTLDTPLTQVIGIPGKENTCDIFKQLEGRHDTIIMLDPDAKREAVAMARAMGGARVVDLPGKCDDLIVEYGLDKKWLETVLYNARKVV